MFYYAIDPSETSKKAITESYEYALFYKKAIKIFVPSGLNFKAETYGY
jgi:hypothetical protein